MACNPRSLLLCTALLALSCVVSCKSASIPSCTLNLHGDSCSSALCRVGNRLSLTLSCKPGPQALQPAVRIHPRLSATQLSGVRLLDRGCPDTVSEDEGCLLSFCSSTTVTFEQPSIHNVKWPGWSNAGVAAAGNSTCVIGVGDSASVTLKRADVFNNTVGSLFRLSGNASLAITEGSRIRDGWGQSGSAVYADGVSAVLISNSTLSFLSTRMDGGALLVKDSAHVTLVGSTIRNCKSSEGKGGAIAVLDFANATIANSSVVESNHATEGGAISLTSNARLLVLRSSIRNNTSTGVGGAVSMTERATMASLHSLWTFNNATGAGGLLSTVVNPKPSDPVTFVFKNSKALHNSAGGVGGALRLTETTTARLSDCLFANNTSGEIGGAVAVMGTTSADITRCVIKGNTASKMGGGVSSWNSARLRVHKCRIQHNSATEPGGGGAAVFNFGYLSITDSTVVSNRGRVDAGGIRVSENGRVDVTRTLVAGNVAGKGGGMWVDEYASVVVTDSNLSSNSAVEFGGGLFVNGSHSEVTLTGTRLLSNSALKGGGLYSGVLKHASGEVKVHFVRGNQLLGNSATFPNSSDVHVTADTVFIMPANSSNLLLSSSTVWWPVQCPIGSSLAAAEGRCRTCESATYSLTAANTGGCQRCLSAAECFGGALVAAKEGFWHTHGPAGGTLKACQLDNIIRCPNPDACKHEVHQLRQIHPFQHQHNSTSSAAPTPGQRAHWTQYEQQQCDVGFTGKLCSVCDRPAYGQTDIFSCEKCSEGWVVIMSWVFYAVGFLVFVLVVLAKHLRDNPPPSSDRQCSISQGPKGVITGVLKCTFLYYTYLAGGIAKLTVTWPHLLSGAFRELSKSWGLLMGSSASFDCFLSAARPAAGTDDAATRAGLKGALPLLATCAMFALILLLLAVWFWVSPVLTPPCQWLWGCLMSWCCSVLCYVRNMRKCCGAGSASPRPLQQCSGAKSSGDTVQPCAAWHGTACPSVSEYWHRVCVYCQCTRWHGMCQYMKWRFLPALLLTLFFWFPYFARTFIGMLACMRVCGQRYWVIDMTLACPWASDAAPEVRAWAVGVAVPAGLLTVLPLLALPLLYSICMAKHMPKPVFLCQFAFLYNGAEKAYPDGFSCSQGKAAERAGAGVEPCYKRLWQRCKTLWHCRKHHWQAFMHRFIVLWDLVNHITTVLVMCVSVFGAGGLHEYYQVLLLIAIFGAYLVLLICVKPLEGSLQFAQGWVMLVLVTTCMCVMGFIAPDGLDTRQQWYFDTVVSQMCAWIIVIINVLCPLVLVLVLAHAWRATVKQKQPRQDITASSSAPDGCSMDGMTGADCSERRSGKDQLPALQISCGK